MDALYLADSPGTAWAEWYRWLAEAALVPRAGLPRVLWAVEVALEAAADLRTMDALEAAGLSAPRPNRLEWPAFQAVGERLHAAGRAHRRAERGTSGRGRAVCLLAARCGCDAQPPLS